LHKKNVKKMTFVDTLNKGQYNENTKWYYQLETLEKRGVAKLTGCNTCFFTPKIGTTTWK
jgi:hypothetical protein